MDKPLSVHEKKATKHTKTKKQPVKVVYISNPMKVQTSASEFRALVQELTGQDSVLPEPVKCWKIDRGGGHQMVPDRRIKITDHDEHAGVRVPRMEPDPVVLHKRSDLASEPYDDEDDVFMPQMLEDFSAGLVPSNLFYESQFPHHVDHVFRSDAV